jgi:hypothetical protein
MQIRFIDTGTVDTLTLELNTRLAGTVQRAEVACYPAGIPFDSVHVSGLIEKARLYFNMAERTQAPREMKA